MSDGLSEPPPVVISQKYNQQYNSIADRRLSQDEFEILNKKEEAYFNELTNSENSSAGLQHILSRKVIIVPFVALLWLFVGSKGGFKVKSHVVIAGLTIMILSMQSVNSARPGTIDISAAIRQEFNADLAQEFGNVHFGIVAAANRFSLETAMLGGGAAQVLLQGGGNISDLTVATGVWFAPQDTIRNWTTRGFTWGDISGDAPAIMRGWDYYHGTR